MRSIGDELFFMAIALLLLLVGVSWARQMIKPLLPFLLVGVACYIALRVTVGRGRF